MSVSSRPKAREEPVGIVISQGRREDPPPAFRAYIWAPAPVGQEPPNSELG
jgi:hypothetical protein